VTLAAGFRLGPYEIQAPIGAGGMGEVYKARDTRLGRTVAVKILPAFAAADPDRRRRFEYEARAASALEHPNICVLHDIGCETPVHPSRPDSPGGPLHFLVMEYVEGRTLADRLRTGPLPLGQVLDVGAQIGDALAVAHARGIVHRDLKPANVMLVGSSGAPRVKLLDFGLAKLSPQVLEAAADAETVPRRDPLTIPGAFVGTLPYMAPEQLEGKEADARSDVFAFGCVLYEMLTGRRAFAGSSMASVISSIMTGPPPSAASLQPVTPYALDRLISGCLARDRTERRESAHDLAEDLRSIAASDIGRLVVPGVTPSTPGSGPERKGRRLKIPWLAIAVAAALVMTAVAVYQRARPGESDDPVLRAKPTQLTSSPGLQGEPALSPDGSQVAFVSDDGGTPHVWLVAADGASTLQLTTGDDPDHDPAWLQDGSAILFTRIRNGRHGIWRVPRLGGVATLLVADAADPAVSPDGLRLAFVREVARSAEPRVFVAPLRNVERAEQRTTDADGKWEHRHPAWSPDGRMLCYRAHYALWTVSPDGGKAERLTLDNESARHPAWSSDGRFVYYTSGREGTVALWRVGIDNRRSPQRMTPGSGPESDPNVSRDGKTLVYSTNLEDYNVVVRDLASGVEWPFGNRRVEQMPRFSRDGSSVIFVSDRVDGRDELWEQPLADGVASGDARRVTRHDAGDVVHPAVSPDGHWIAYYRVVEDQRDVYIVSMDGVSPVRFTTNPADDIQPAWSPDGSQIAFTSARDGLFHIWVAPAANGRLAGPDHPLTRGPVREMAPEWSPDGAWIAYTAEPTASTGDVWMMRSDGSGTPQRVTAGAGALRVRWIKPDQMMVSGSWGAATLSVRYVDPLTGTVTVPSPPIVFGDDQAMCDFDVDMTRGRVVFGRVTRTGNIWKLNGRF
jgi:Tol biopolymer transport system component/serine/threonine protein kinase